MSKVYLYASVVTGLVLGLALTGTPSLAADNGQHALAAPQVATHPVAFNWVAAKAQATGQQEESQPAPAKPKKPKPKKEAKPKKETEKQPESEKPQQ